MFVASIAMWFTRKHVGNNTAKMIMCAILFFISYVLSDIYGGRLPFTLDIAIGAVAFMIIGYISGKFIERLLQSNTCRIKNIPTTVILAVTYWLCLKANPNLFYNRRTKKLLLEIKLSRDKFNIIYVKEVFLSGIWNSLNTLGSILLVSTSLIMANIFYGASAAGEYSIVQVVPNFINGLISMLTGVFFPMIMISFAQNDRSELMKVVKKAQSIVGLLSVTIIGTFIGFSSRFFSLWVPRENTAVLFLLSTITILPHILIGCMWPINALNAAMNKVKFPALFLIGAGLCNIFFSYICFKFFSFGLISIVSVSSAIQIIWIAIFMPLYASKSLNLKYVTFYPFLLKGVSCFFIALILSTSLISYFSIDNWIEFMFIGGISGILSLSVNALIMIGFKDIKSIFKK